MLLNCLWPTSSPRHPLASVLEVDAVQVWVQAAACARIAAAAAATSCLPQASACRPGLCRAGCKHGVCRQQLPPVAPWEVPAPKPVLVLLPACVEPLSELGLGLQVEVNQASATRVSALHLPSVTGAPWVQNMCRLQETCKDPSFRPQ